MEEILTGTYTYIARSAENPEKVATFTLEDDTIAVQLGEAILEQLVSATALIQADNESVQVMDWVKPIAASATQTLLRPFPLADFDASYDNGTLRATAWLRSAGLRLFPVSISWSGVDNPDAAAAFVEEVGKRKTAVVEIEGTNSIMDYWATWIVIGVSGAVLISAFLKRLSSLFGNSSE